MDLTSASNSRTAASGGNVEPLLWACHDTLVLVKRKLAQPFEGFILFRMDLIYPINFEGHDEWIESGYALKLAGGDVITHDGEVLGVWRVVEYDPDAENEGGQFEFIMDGQDVVKFSEDFAFLDYRNSRGFALSNLTRAIREWHESQPS